MSDWTLTGHEWTAVSTPPRRPGRLVLLLCRDNRMRVGSHGALGWSTQNTARNVTRDDVTHWRHLPPPPPPPTVVMVRNPLGVATTFTTTSTVSHETEAGGGWSDVPGGRYIRHTITWEETP